MKRLRTMGTAAIIVAVGLFSIGIARNRAQAGAPGAVRARVMAGTADALASAGADGTQAQQVEAAVLNALDALDAQDRAQAVVVPQALLAATATPLNEAVLEDGCAQREAAALATDAAAQGAVLTAHDTLNPSQRRAVAKFIRQHKPLGNSKDFDAYKAQLDAMIARVLPASVGKRDASEIRKVLDDLMHKALNLRHELPVDFDRAARLIDKGEIKPKDLADEWKKDGEDRRRLCRLTIEAASRVSERLTPSERVAVGAAISGSVLAVRP